MIRLLLALGLTLGLLHAQGRLISGIPLPKTYVQNLDPYRCDDACLRSLIRHEQVFSFLAQVPEAIEDSTLNEQRLIYVSLFNLESGEQGSGSVRIALLLPEKVIGHYAASTTNSVLTYLLGKNRNFELKTYTIGDESTEALQSGLDAIAADRFVFVIAPLTRSGARKLAQLPLPAQFYLPTVNKNDVNASQQTLYFGGIDYASQIKALMREAKPPLVIFYDRSTLGRMLKEATVDTYLEQISERDIPGTASRANPKVYTYPVGKHTTNLRSVLKNNQKIKRGTFFLNTPLVKSAMIMSQLTLYDVNASRILSTQISYESMLFDMTQTQDRTEMIVANSITSNNSVLEEENLLMQNDIRYDWINYAATLGADLFYHLSTGSPREFSIPMQGQQMHYPIALYRPQGGRFERYETQPLESEFFDSPLEE